MKDYIAPLKEQFELFADPAKAEWSRKYLKEQFEFYGLNTKLFREIVWKFFNENGYPLHDELDKFVRYMYDLPQREYQYTVIELFHKQAKKLKKEDIRLIEFMITNKSWWETVDGIAAWICGVYFMNFPEQIRPVTGKWMDSQNIWLQRAALLFQLKYKKQTDLELLTLYIEQLRLHKDFFIRKAIGWVLREYSKTDKAWVKNFAENHSLSGLSRKEALKYC